MGTTPFTLGRRHSKHVQIDLLKSIHKA